MRVVMDGKAEVGVGWDALENGDLVFQGSISEPEWAYLVCGPCGCRPTHLVSLTTGSLDKASSADKRCQYFKVDSTTTIHATERHE